MLPCKYFFCFGCLA